MKFKVFLQNHFGQACCHHGNVWQRGLPVPAILDCDSLDEARLGANDYVQRFTELECVIQSEDASFTEVIRNEDGQRLFLEKYKRYFENSKLESARNVALIALVLLSVIANIVMGVLLWRYL